MAPTVAEMISALKAKKTKKEKIEYIRKNQNVLGFVSVLRLRYDDRFVFRIPEGVPPNMKKNVTAPGMGEVSLLSEYKKLYIYLKNGAPAMKQAQCELSFLSLVESLDKEESALLLELKDKTLDVGVTKAVLKEALPKLLPE